MFRITTDSEELEVDSDFMGEVDAVAYGASTFYAHMTRYKLPVDLAHELTLMYFNSILLRLIQNNETSV